MTVQNLRPGEISYSVNAWNRYLMSYNWSGEKIQLTRWMPNARKSIDVKMTE